MIIACYFRVSALSSHAALALSPSGIASKLNSPLSAALGKVARLSTDWQDAAYPLVFESVASGAWAVVQISPSKQQCGKQQVSLKAAYEMH